MGKFMKVTVPATRDPFVNNYLTPAGKDKESGEERFFRSTWNANSGGLAAMITPTGKSKIFRFDPERKQFGFYGAAYADNDIMWLSGRLSEIVKLDLQTGNTQTWQTGLTPDLSFSGLAYDPATGKVFSATYVQADLKRKAFSFDTKSEKIVKLYEDIPAKSNYSKNSIRNKNGTFTIFNVTPSLEMMIWDPVNETIEVLPERFEMEDGAFGSFVTREDGAIYIPFNGWFDPILKKFTEGPKAPHETSWFAMRGNEAYGAEYSESGNATLYKWNLEKQEVSKIIEIPDSGSFMLTEAGKIICINLYGFFYRVDPSNAAIECSVKLESDAVGHIDCLHRINEERLLCTPFITQRFYEINLSDGKGVDLGRATGGGGEVLKITEIDGKIYMASYTSGQMVEYDPKEHANFPENPRIVVYPPHNALRPVGMCNDGKSVYYTCSHEYGHLGSILIKYTPSEGTTLFEDEPIPNQMVRSMLYDPETRCLIAGTTYAADCNSCVPVDDHCMLTKINADTLKVETLYHAPDNAKEAIVYGKLCERTYLCRLTGGKLGDRWLRLNADSFEITEFTMPEELAAPFSVYYYESTGLYVITDAKGVHLYDLEKGIKVRDICDETGFYRVHVQDSKVYLVYRSEIRIY